jgi:hypothetical protein
VNVDVGVGEKRPFGSVGEVVESQPGRDEHRTTVAKTPQTIAPPLSFTTRAALWALSLEVAVRVDDEMGRAR